MWPKYPSRETVLKTLTSIPQDYTSDYVIRGMICKGDDGQHVCFFRRILIKIEHLVSLAALNSYYEYCKMEDEITPQTEWVLYNDNELMTVRDNFPGVIETCIE